MCVSAPPDWKLCVVRCICSSLSVPRSLSVRLRVLEGSLRVFKSPVAADRKPAQSWPCGRVMIVVCGRVPWKVPGSVPAEFRSYPLFRCSCSRLPGHLKQTPSTAAQLSSGL